MWEDSLRLGSNGCSYTNEGKSCLIDWVEIPRFFRKGNIIVQYPGSDIEIISDLWEMFEGQFAGSY